MKAIKRNFYNYAHANPVQFKSQGAKVKRTAQGDIYSPDYSFAAKKGIAKSIKSVFGGATVGGAMGRLVKKAKIPSYKKGGVIKKTGLAYVHKGEKITKKKKR